MKKYISLVMSVLMLVTLVTGCGAKDTPTQEESKPDTQVSQSTVDKELEVEKETENTPELKVVNSDIVVVGAGAGGLAAALEAVNSGAEKVILLEMTGKTGGSLNFTSGSMSAAETILQKEDGIEDTKQSYFDDLKRIGSDFDGEVSEEHLKLYVDESQKAFDWLWEMGLKDYEFQKDRATGARAVFAPEHPLYSIQRTYKARPQDAKTYKAPAHEILDKAVAAESKIELLLNTKGIELVPNEKGQITAVIGKNLLTGEEVKYESKHGVIITTGGYSANKALMGEFTKHGSSYISGSPASADGNALPMMQNVGAALTHMEYVPTFPMGLEDLENPGTGSIASTYMWKAGGICVNKDGKRFINETESNNSIREVALEEQPDAVQYDIFTDEILNTLTELGGAGMYQFKFGEGTPGSKTVVTASTLDELAQKAGINAENLKKTVEDYNKAVDAKGTDELGRLYDGTKTPFNLAVNKIEGDKYYAVPLKALCIITLGGVETNTDMQVLDESGNVIPGLYAAGEVVGGIWGKFVSGGTGVMGPISFGRVAARNAMSKDMAEGYTVKKSSNVLDAKLFEKAKSTEAKYDMTASFKDGEYTSTVDGQNGTMEVKVTIKDSKIANVEILSNNETETVAAAALESVPKAIVANNSPDVDTVSNATLTSNRIMNAVKACLDKAKA